MTEPAYFLTWTTRGTWLHGDERGSVDREHNIPGMPWVPPDTVRHAAIRQRLNCKPVLLSNSQRDIISRAIKRVCDRRGWRLRAINVRSNHVHVVVNASSHRPETVMGQLKSWATRDLRANVEIEPVGRIWTNHGSTRWIKVELSLRAAIDYALNQQ